MSLYLYQNDKQSGPFSEEEVRQKLQQGTVLPATLAWREGTADWMPLASLLQLALPPAPPAQGRAMLGIISLSYGGVSAIGWLVLFTVAGIATAHGKASPEFNAVIGLVAMAGLLFNVVALVLGIIGAFQNRGRALAIGGACLNACVVVGIVLLIVIGITVKHTQAGS